MPIQLNASDIHLRSSQAMGLRSTDPFTILVWINATWTGGARISMVGLYGPSADTPLGTPITAVQIGTTNGSGELSTWSWGGGALVTTASSAMNAYNGLWVHIAYTYNGTTHLLYRNGVQVASATNAQIAGYLNQVYINGYPTGGTSEVGALQVDSYTLFRRVLTPDEILTMFTAQGDRHGITTGLIAHYDFDELGQGVASTNVTDMSGNGNTLTSTGAGSAITYTYPTAYANSNLRPVQ
jgi:hypothetical protein